MNLKLYNDKRVRIITNYKEIFEGISLYNSKDYNEHEFGRNEESLQIENYIFYKKDIKKIKIINKYTNNYGYLEEMIIKDDFVEDVLFSEYDEHVLRLLNYIEDNINNYDYNVYEKYFNDLLKCSKNSKIRNKVVKIIDNLKK